MESILDDLDAYPEEMLDTVIERIGLEAEFQPSTRPGRGCSLVSVFAVAAVG